MGKETKTTTGAGADDISAGVAETGTVTETVTETGTGTDNGEESRFTVKTPEAEDEAPESRVLCEVNGLQIRSNAIYQIVGKEDQTAPDAYRDMGTSKLPNPDIGSYAGCMFDWSSGTYDTGFFESSACYRGINSEVKKREVALRKKYIMQPYEDVVGIGKLEHTNLEFWDNFSCFIREGDALFTSDPVQLFQLYVLIQSKHVMPKELEGSPDYPPAMYCIQDQHHVVDVKQKRVEQRMKATAKFMNLRETDYARLTRLLLWVGVDVTDLDRRMASPMFDDYLNDARHPHNAEMFVELCESSLEEYDKLNLYYLLTGLLRRGRLTKGSTGYSLEGYDLGPNLKEAAGMLAKDKAMADARLKVLSYR
jgi:hypothetical protein